MNTELDGADYSRGLGKDLEEAANIAAVERRAVPRYKCTGEAQVREEKSEVCSAASISDISMHGCYLETASTFPVGTCVYLQIELERQRLILKGEVRVAYPDRGIGIKFCDLSVENRAQLAEVVHSVASRMHLVLSPPNRPEVMPILPDVRDPERALDLLRGFFQRRKVMSREEFIGMLQTLSAPQ